MHAVLAAAIANPRFARPYGTDPGEWGFEAGISGVDNFVKGNKLLSSFASEEAKNGRRFRPIATNGLN